MIPPPPPIHTHFQIRYRASIIIIIHAAVVVVVVVVVLLFVLPNCVPEVFDLVQSNQKGLKRRSLKMLKHT